MYYILLFCIYVCVPIANNLYDLRSIYNNNIIPRDWNFIRCYYNITLYMYIATLTDNIGKPDSSIPFTIIIIIIMLIYLGVTRWYYGRLFYHDS